MTDSVDCASEVNTPFEKGLRIYVNHVLSKLKKVKVTDDYPKKTVNTFRHKGRFGDKAFDLWKPFPEWNIADDTPTGFITRPLEEERCYLNTLVENGLSISVTDDYPKKTVNTFRHKGRFGDKAFDLWKPFPEWNIADDTPTGFIIRPLEEERFYVNHFLSKLKKALDEIPDPILGFPQTSDYFTNYEQNGAHCSEQEQTYLLSGVYLIGNNGNRVLKMEHSASQGPSSQWDLEVKYRQRGNTTKRWVNIWNFYPDAKVELKHNEVELTISSPNEDHEFAVFGRPEIEDKKRMQMGIFGGKPTQGKHWHIFVTLFDDTMIAFKRVCEREESNGRELLTTLAGLFVSNSDDDIKIDITALEDGWKIIGSHLLTIKSKDAWNSPENSTDFPYCVFEIAHMDETKQTFFSGVQASHLIDTAETELLAFFEKEQENKVHLNSQKFIPEPVIVMETKGIFGAFISFLVLIFLAGSLTGTRLGLPLESKNKEY